LAPYLLTFELLDYLRDSPDPRVSAPDVSVPLKIQFLSDKIECLCEIHTVKAFVRFR